MMQDFKKLEVWHLAHRLTLELFRTCDRRFVKYPGLRAQMLRAVQWIGSNIAEGSGSEGAEFARYLGMSLKSTREVENDLLVARDLSVISMGEFTALDERVDHLRRKLISLIRTVKGS